MNDIIRHIQQLSKEFTRRTLDESEVNSSPFTQFDKWFQEAIESYVSMPDAMTVATATKEGIPSARILLLRNFDESGFCFYTNYHSKKAMDLELNPHACNDATHY